MVFDRMREQLARVFGMNWAEVSGESTLDVSVALLDDSQVTFLRIWAVVNSTWQSVQGMNLLLTSSTAQQSTPAVLKKRDSLKLSRLTFCLG